MLASQRPFTVEAGKYYQAENLAEWKTKLKEECYKDLVEFVEYQNSLLTEGCIGYAVCRGNDLSSFVANWKPSK